MLENRHLPEAASNKVDTSAFWSAFWKSIPEEEADVWYYLDEVKFQHLVPFLPSSGKVLEVGCGSARLSRFLAAAGFDAIPLDYDRGAIRYAQREFQRVGLHSTLVLGDANRLPFQSGSFDMVLSTGLLEHFEDPSPTVAEMVRTLRSGGLFYSDIVPKKFSLLRSLDFLRRHRGEMFERPFTKSQIVDFLRRAGLEDITVFAAGVFPPRLPLVERWRRTRRLQNRIAAVGGRLGRFLDRTKAAEFLGVYYFACGRKPALSLAWAVSGVEASLGGGSVRVQEPLYERVEPR